MCTSSSGTENVTSFTCKLDDKEISRPYYRVRLPLSYGFETLYIPLIAKISAKAEISIITFQLLSVALLTSSCSNTHPYRHSLDRTKISHIQPTQDGNKILLLFALEYHSRDKKTFEGGRCLFRLKTHCSGSIRHFYSIVEIQSCRGRCEILSQHHNKYFLVHHIRYFFQKRRLKRKLGCAVITYNCNTII